MKNICLPGQEAYHYSSASTLFLNHVHSGHDQQRIFFYSAHNQKFFPSKHHMIQGSVE